MNDSRFIDSLRVSVALAERLRAVALLLGLEKGDKQAFYLDIEVSESLPTYHRCTWSFKGSVPNLVVEVGFQTLEACEAWTDLIFEAACIILGTEKGTTKDLPLPSEPEEGAPQ